MSEDSQSKKLSLFYVLDVLRKYTDAEHTMTQNEIQEKLKSEYGVELERKTIKTSLMSLEEFGYDLGYTETVRPTKNKKTGEMEDSYVLSDFYMQHEFDDSELRLLIDGLLFSKHVPYKQCKELVEKLEGLSNVYFKSRIKHISPVPRDRTTSQTSNQQLFYTIAILDEAITKKCKVRFKYTEYTTDFTRKPKKNAKGEDRVYLVTPYQMAAKEGKYYLICNYDKYDNISNYRIDRITDIELLEDEKARPFKELNGANGQPLDMEKYMNEHIYMYSSKSTHVKLRISNAMISDLVDQFGTNVKFSNQDEDYVNVTVEANEDSIIQFAKNYAPAVVILSPKSTRDEVIKELRDGLAGYEE